MVNIAFGEPDKHVDDGFDRSQVIGDVWNKLQFLTK